MAPLLLRSRKTTKAKGGTTSQLRETFFSITTVSQQKSRVKKVS